MARRHSSRRSRRKPEGVPILALTLFILVLLGVGGGMGWMYFDGKAKHPPVDAELCPLTGPTEQTIVLVDATDAVAPITQQEVMTKVADLANATKKWARFELRILVPGSDRTNILFSKCNPGDGSDLNEYNGNPALARKNWVSLFRAPLEQSMAKSMSGSGAETSPIMAGIQQIAVDRLSSEQERAVFNRVLVVSDMLENSEYFSVYQSGSDIDAYRASPAQKRFNTDLAGAEIAIWLIERETKVPTVGLMEFWAEWILQNRGSPGKITRLQGLE